MGDDKVYETVTTVKLCGVVIRWPVLHEFLSLWSWNDMSSLERWNELRGSEAIQ